MTEKQNKDWFKYGLGFVVCLLLRLIPFRTPNIEPLLATQMPFSRVYGQVGSFFFAFASIFLYDSLTSGIGVWTFITAFAYGFLGIWAVAFFKNREASSLNYAKFAVMATIAYDIVTGFTVGPLFFNQPFMAAVVGQIPFTILHLIGNVVLAITVSPIIDYYIIRNEKISYLAIKNLFTKTV